MDDIIIRIQNGEFDDSIDSIIAVARIRKDALAHAKAHTLKATLQPGDRVVVNGLSPKYCNGRTATVVSVNRTRVVVNPEEPIGRFAGRVTVPLTCVSPV